MILQSKNGFFREFIWLLIAVVLYLSIFGIRIYLKNQHDPGTMYLKFQKEIALLEFEAGKRTDLLIRNFNRNTGKVNSSLLEKDLKNLDKNEISLFIAKGDSLVYWNDNKVIIQPVLNKTCNKENFACRQMNGWYGFHCVRQGPFCFIGAYLIKSEFPFQNDYLTDHFSDRFNLPASISISSATGSYPVRAKDGHFLFSLTFENYQPASDDIHGIVFLVFITGSLFLFYFLYLLFSAIPWFKDRNNLFLITYGIVIALFRICQYYCRFPSEIYQSELFTPAWYSSSSFLPSLGDFALNSIILTVASVVIYKKAVRGNNTFLSGRLLKFAQILLSLGAVLLFFLAAGYLISDLVINSALSLNLQNISGLTRESAIGMFIILTLVFSLWLLSATLFDIVFHTYLPKKWLILSAIVVIGIYGLICVLSARKLNITVGAAFLVYLAWHWYFKLKNRPVFSVQNLMFLFCFYSVFTTLLLNEANLVKETGKLNLLAGKLVSRQNPVTEILYEQVERRLIADSALHKWINQDPGSSKLSKDSLAGYIKTVYFKDYWKKYQIQITFCDPSEELQIQPSGYLVDCHEYFIDLINKYGLSTACPDFFFLDYGFGKEYYLARLTGKSFGINQDEHPVIFVEFNLKNAFTDPGYPGLLMDKTRLEPPDLSTYSYGLFQSGKLIRSEGASGYKTELDQYEGISSEKSYFKEDRMIHYPYRINDTVTLIISKAEDNFLSFAAPFSYLFILFSAITMIISALTGFPKSLNFLMSGLRNRLNLSLLGILMVTMLAIGIVQALYIIRINSKKNIDNLRERTCSVVVEVQHRFSMLKGIQEVSQGALEDFLVKLSNVFFTDINVYNETGLLVSSSRPQIFEEGLLTERMNPTAVQRLIVGRNTIDIHNESIGNMQFNSAYMPFYNEHDQLLGFVNLPYFAKQDESKKEVSSFLVTFINIYILLILFGVLITVLISNYITAPLSMLADKISHLRLGKANEKIIWKQNDEIGQLVSEYNRMIEELERSAGMLARSERESAWREMARQVAHEIKNPLTPMKLSAQHLEKARNENARDLDQRLARFTRTLVEQIDALSAIATDFSDFAKMPPVVYVPVDLEDVIRFVLSLYQDSTAIRYDFQSEVSQPYILADRPQLIRVFTNLMNNAVQAIGDHREGLISIHITRHGQEVIVSISDNGCGIPADRNESIFQPDFTTKTSGMGLGLAIVKGIVEAMGGEISFRSEQNKGTTFMIKFIANDDYPA